MKNKVDRFPVPTGVLVVIGGHENKGEGPETEIQKRNFTDEEVLRTFLDLTGKKPPRIAVITSASGMGEESFKDYERVFSENGVKSVIHIHHNNRNEAMDDPQMDQIEAADAVFIAGGDQLQLTSIYGGTSFLKRLKERYIYEKLVVAGTSAGAMAMSTPMIYAGSGEVQEVTGEIKITTGLEFLRDVCVDTHFVDRGRWVRMAQVVATNPTCVGIGIQEDTALIVTQGTHLEVCGSGLVVIIDGHHMTHTNLTEKIPVSVRDLDLYLLARGNQHVLPDYNPPHV